MTPLRDGSIPRLSLENVTEVTTTADFRNGIGDYGAKDPRFRPPREAPTGAGSFW